jgi:hypothetical protein
MPQSSSCPTSPPALLKRTRKASAVSLNALAPAAASRLPVFSPCSSRTRSRSPARSSINPKNVGLVASSVSIICDSARRSIALAWDSSDNCEPLPSAWNATRRLSASNGVPGKLAIAPCMRAVATICWTWRCCFSCASPRSSLAARAAPVVSFCASGSASQACGSRAASARMVRPMRVSMLRISASLGGRPSTWPTARMQSAFMRRSSKSSWPRLASPGLVRWRRWSRLRLRPALRTPGVDCPRRP